MRVRLVYSKRGGACFVPHIALAQMFARAAVRAGFRLEMTQGFSPRARVSFGPELPAGVVAMGEVVDMYFAGDSAGNVSPHKNNNSVVSVADNCAGAVNASVADNSTGAVNASVADNSTGVVNASVAGNRAGAVNAPVADNHAGTVNDVVLSGKNPAAVDVDDVMHNVFVDAMNSALPQGFKVSRVLFPSANSPSLGKSCKHAEYLIRHTLGLDLLNTATNFFGSAVLKAQPLNGWLRLILHDPSQHPIGGFVKHMIAQNLITGWHEMNIVRISIGIYDSQKDCVCINA